MKDAHDDKHPGKDKDMPKTEDKGKGNDKEKDKSPSAQEEKVLALDLGHRSGSATLRLAADRKRLQVELAIDPKGLDKTGVNGLIDALKKLRDKMDR